MVTAAQIQKLFTKTKKRKTKIHNHREKITNYFIPQNNKINHIMNKTISLLYSLLILIIQVGAARKDAQTTPIIVTRG